MRIPSLAWFSANCTCCMWQLRLLVTVTWLTLYPTVLIIDRNIIYCPNHIHVAGMFLNAALKNKQYVHVHVQAPVPNSAQICQHCILWCQHLLFHQLTSVLFHCNKNNFYYYCKHKQDRYTKLDM